MRFWSVLGRTLGAKGRDRRKKSGSLLATIFHQKSEKRRQGSPKGPQSLEKRHLKINVKNCIEQLRKSMPKGHQNDTKMEPKINDLSCFLEKGENARNHCIYKLKRGSGHVKSNEKLM